MLLVPGLVGACKDPEPADDDVSGPDADGDGFTADEGDCDDTDPAIHPMVAETCDDGVDVNCDGIEDDGCEILIEAGEFVRGLDDAEDYIPYTDEKPQATIQLGEYHIDRYEVTNLQYQRCVETGPCDPPAATSSYTHEAYHGNPEYWAFPVVHVTHEQAGQYCSWLGRALPTEAQWEKAGRGPAPSDQDLSWGPTVKEDQPECDMANYGFCYEDTMAVNAFPDSVTPYGVYQMSGNVLEWVADWYDVNAYEDDVDTDPTGPATGMYRSMRGGAWSGGWYDGRVLRRRFALPGQTSYDLGFRCARPTE